MFASGLEKGLDADHAPAGIALMAMRYAHLSQGHLRDEIARNERPSASPMFDSKEMARRSRESQSSGVAVS